MIARLRHPDPDVVVTRSPGQGAQWVRVAGEAALALLVAGAALRDYLLTLPKEFIRSAMVAEAVVDGEPPWRIFQSRVLGPYLVHGLSAITRTPPAVMYGMVAIALLFACAFLLLRLTHRLRDPARPPLAALLAYQGTLLVMLPCIWLYVWDLISLVVFTLFSYLVLRGGARWSMALLFAVAIFNHELALAIAAWMALDPVIRYLAAGRARDVAPGARERFDRVGLLLGVGLLAAGVALIETLRRVLLVRELPPPEAADALSAHGGSLHFTLGRNWDAIAHSFSFEPQSGLQFVVPLFLGLVMVVAARLARSDWPRYGALAIVTGGMVASMLCFGLILETRVLLPLVPFIAMNGWAALRELADTVPTS